MEKDSKTSPMTRSASRFNPRTINGSALSNTPRLGGGGSAGPDRSRDLESLAYDQTNDVLYAFSGSCCAIGVLPTAYRLRRVRRLTAPAVAKSPTSTK